MDLYMHAFSQQIGKHVTNYTYTVLSKPNRVYKTFSYYLPFTEPSSISMTFLSRLVGVLPTILYTVLSTPNRVHETFVYYLPFTEPSSTSMTSLSRLVGVLPTILYTVLSNTERCSSRKGITTLISGRLVGYRRSLQLSSK